MPGIHHRITDAQVLKSAHGMDVLDVLPEQANPPEGTLNKVIGGINFRMIQEGSELVFAVHEVGDSLGVEPV